MGRQNVTGPGREKPKPPPVPLGAKRVADLDIDITVTNEAWTAAVPDAETRIRAALHETLAQHPRGAAKPQEVAVLLADDATVQELNRNFRGQDKPTNVLSFPAAVLPEAVDVAPLGDIALAFETIEREARAADKAVAQHMIHLVVHGMLHLLGFTHDEDAAAETMVAAEIAVLNKLGLPDPYVAPDLTMGAA